MKPVFVKQSVMVLALAVWLLGAAGCEKPPVARTATDTNDSKSLSGQPTPANTASNSDTKKDVAYTATDADDRSAATADAKVIAYYFHRTMRCPTCLSIEQQAREAVETAYSEELNSGKLEWHAVNIEEEGNEHFESDFALSSSSLVLVQMDGDDVAAWKNLERVWELVEDPLGFQEYVWNELTELLPG